MSEKVIEILESLGCEETKIDQYGELIKSKVSEFLISPSQIYCQTCGVTFYRGPAWGIMDKSDVILDFRYLAFRHAWDNPTHKILVDLSFLRESTHSLHTGIFVYSSIVDQFRSKLRREQNTRAWKSCDENWDPLQDRVLCSNCKKKFNDIKRACYCCYGAKPFLPYSELENY